MALVGSTANQNKLQGIINSCEGAMTGSVSSANVLDGQVVGLRGFKGDKGDTGAQGVAGHSPVLTSEKYGTTTVIYSDGDELAQIEDGATIDVKVHNKLSASDTTAYNSIVANGVAQLHPGLLGNVGVVMEATDTAASQAMKHLMFKSDYSSGMRLADGGIVLIKFMADVYNSATLNLHLQDAAYTGDIPIYDNGSAITMGKIMENDIVALMYDDRNTRFNVISKVYKAYTSTSQGLVPAYGNVASDEYKILTNSGWQTIVKYSYSSLDAFFESKATLASPSFTGTPKAPTAASGTDTTQIATTAFVQDAVSGISSDVTDVKVDSVSVVTSGVANINTFTGATYTSGSGTTAGTKGLVPAPPAGSGGGSYIPKSKVLTAAGTWESFSGRAYESLGNVYVEVDIGGTIGAGFSLPKASSSSTGTMSSSDKTKLDSITLTNGVIDASCLPVWDGGVV